MTKGVAQMETGRSAAGLLLVDKHVRAERLKKRASDLGVRSARALERVTEAVDRKVSRAKIGEAFDGEATEAIYDRLEAALDLWDVSISPANPEPSKDLKFTVHNFFGIGEVIAEGPPEMGDELVEHLAKLLHDVRRQAERGQS